jgi:hypothetical protein
MGSLWLPLILGGAVDLSRAALGGSLVFVVLAPVLVGVVRPTASPAQTSALTISLSQNGLFATQTPENTYVGVQVAGPPPEHPASLVNKSGTVAVNVAVIKDNSKCPSPSRSVGITTSNVWCLDIASVPLATEVTGQLTGEATTLTLTVDARHGFWWLPFIVIVLSFLLATVLAVAPGFLDSLIQQARLWDIVRTSTSLTGLGPWVRTRLQRGADVNDLIKVIGGLAEAPVQAQQARDGLRAAMQTLHANHPNHPVLAVAAAEADKSPPGQATGPQPVTDFVDNDGKPVIHPATVLTELVNLISELYGQLDDIDQRIAQLDAFYAVNPRREANAARRALDTVTTVDAAQAARHQVDVAWSVYVAVAANPASQPAGFAQAAAVAPGQPLTAFSRPGDLTLAQPTTSLTVAAAWTALFAIAVAAIGVASVVSANYLGKPTFGSGADYLALSLAAFGSSAAATIATVLAYWHIART